MVLLWESIRYYVSSVPRMTGAFDLSDPKLLPLLNEAQRLLPRDFPTSPNPSLRRILNEASAKLPSSVGPNHSPLSWRDLGRLIVDASDSSPTPGRPVPGRSYASRKKSALQAWPGAGYLIQPALVEVFELLANQLATSPPMQTKTSSSNKKISAVDREFAPVLRDRLEENSAPVGLWGESGNGKTFAAQQVITELYDSNHVAHLRFGNSNSDTYRLDLVAALKMAQHDASTWSLAGLEHAMRDELSTGRWFAAAFLDDFDGPTIDRLIPGLTVPMIVTTIEEHPGLNSLYVPEYSEAEAEVASKLAAPSIDAELRRELCRYLGFRPVLLDVAFRLVYAGAWTATDLLNSLKADVSSVVQHLDSESFRVLQRRNRLVIVYRGAAEAVAQGPTAAQEILDAILWTTGSAHLNQVIASACASGEYHDFKIRSGVEHLVKLGLIRILGDFVEVNEVTLSLMRDIQSERASRTAQKFLDRSHDRTEFEQLAKFADGPMSVNFSLASAESARASNAYALGLTVRALDNIAGSTEFGCQQSGNVCVFWDRRAAQPQFWVAVASSDGLSRWSDSGFEFEPVDTVSTSDESFAVMVVTQLANSQSRFPWSNGNLNISWLPTASKPKVRHLEVSFFNEVFLNGGGIHAFSVCGKRIRPGQAGCDLLPACPDCSDRASLPEKLLHLLGALKAIEGLIEKNGREWHLNIGFYNALYALDVGRAKDAAFSLERLDAVAMDTALRYCLVELWLGIFLRTLLFDLEAPSSEELVAILSGFASSDREPDRDLVVWRLRLTIGILLALRHSRIMGPNTAVATTDAPEGPAFSETDTELPAAYMQVPAGEFIVYFDQEEIKILFQFPGQARHIFSGLLSPTAE